MGFFRYMHLERFGTPAVDGIEVGECVVLPKIDGANASVWADWVDYADGGQGEYHVFCGSRNRSLGRIDEDLGIEDNQGFRAWLAGNSDAAERMRLLALSLPDHVFFGEWLVPHTLKTYRPDAWRRFYVFDVWDSTKACWLQHRNVEALCLADGVDFVPAIAIVNNPTAQDLLHIVENNRFLMPDLSEPGEGIVIKRHDYVNRFGNQVWAKIVRQVFKEENRLAFGVGERDGMFQVESAIAEKYVTGELVAKERAKIEAAEIDGAIQPQLLGRAYYCLVTEELWTALKEFKQPQIDFKKLNKFCNEEVKKLAPDLFRRA
jgi:hypothetical protein